MIFLLMFLIPLTLVLASAILGVAFVVLLWGRVVIDGEDVLHNDGYRLLLSATVAGGAALVATLSFVVSGSFLTQGMFGERGDLFWAFSLAAFAVGVVTGLAYTRHAKRPVSEQNKARFPSAQP